MMICCTEAKLPDRFSIVLEREMTRGYAFRLESAQPVNHGCQKRFRRYAKTTAGNIFVGYNFLDE